MNLSRKHGKSLNRTDENIRCGVLSVMKILVNFLVFKF